MQDIWHSLPDLLSIHDISEIVHAHPHITDCVLVRDLGYYHFILNCGISDAISCNLFILLDNILGYRNFWLVPKHSWTEILIKDLHHPWPRLGIDGQDIVWLLLFKLKLVAKVCRQSICWLLEWWQGQWCYDWPELDDEGKTGATWGSPTRIA